MWSGIQKNPFREHARERERQNTSIVTETRDHKTSAGAKNRRETSRERQIQRVKEREREGMSIVGLAGGHEGESMPLLVRL